MRAGSASGKQTRAVARLLAHALVLAACGGRDSAERSPGTVAQTAVSIASPIDSAARQLVSFLRGDTPFSGIVLADSVWLYLGREAGGTKRTVAREQLRRPSSWSVQSRQGTFSFAPLPTMTRLTTKPGAHFICTERQLAASFPQLAPYPHVGVRLEPEERDSCRQTWNVTFVFDASERPRLVAAIYDQSEW